MARSYKQLLTTVESVAEGYPGCIPNLYVYGTWDERALVVESVTGISLQQAAQFTLEFATRPSLPGQWHCEISLQVANANEDSFEEICFKAEARYPQAAASAIKNAQLALAILSHETRGSSPFQGSQPAPEELDLSDRIRIVVYGAPASVNLVVIPDSSPLDFPLRLAHELLGKEEDPNLIAIHCLDTQAYHETIQSFWEKSHVFMYIDAILFKQTPASVESEFLMLEELFAQAYLVDLCSGEEASDDGTLVHDGPGNPFGGSLGHASEKQQAAYDDMLKTQQAANRHLQELKRAREAIPSPASSSGKVLNLLLRYTSTLRTCLEGEGEGSINRIVETALKDFSDSLRKTQPKLLIAKNEAKRECPYTTCEENQKYWTFTIHQIQALSATSRGRMFTSLMLGKLPLQLVAQCQKNWGHQSKLFVEEVQAALATQIVQVGSRILGKFPDLLYRISRQVVGLLKRVDSFHKNELGCPSINDTTNFAGRLDYMKEQYRNAIHDRFNSEDAALLGTSVAYYDMAHHRFCDNVHVSLYTSLLSGLSDSLAEHLISALVILPPTKTLT